MILLSRCHIVKSRLHCNQTIVTPLSLSLFSFVVHHFFIIIITDHVKNLHFAKKKRGGGGRQEVQFHMGVLRERALKNNEGTFCIFIVVQK